MMNNRDIIKIIYNAMNRQDIDGCYLFGSFLTDRFTSESDIDIALIGDIQLEDMLYLEGILEEKIGRNIDLVKLEDLPMYMQLNVVSRDKRVIFKENENTYKYLKNLDYWYKNEYPFWIKMQNELGYNIP